MPSLKSKFIQKSKFFKGSSDRVIGIDNGLTGGIVVLEGRRLLAKCVMPVMSKEKGNEIDILTLRDWLDTYVDENSGFVIERPTGSQGVKPAVSMANSIGQLTALMRIREYRFVMITPQRWQKVMLPNCKTGQTKKFALSVCRNLWPRENWLATERSKKPHEGLIDAALIAEFGRRNRLF